jgi:transcriptional regulator with XRE-family HTH domain
MPRFDGALLRARRKKLNLTLEELGELADLSFASVMKFETGGTRPSITSLERLCRALACDPNSLFAVSDGDDADLRPTDLGTAADRWVAETLASAPPLTERQAARLAAILFGRSA